MTIRSRVRSFPCFCGWWPAAWFGPRERLAAGERSPGLNDALCHLPMKLAAGEQLRRRQYQRVQAGQQADADAGDLEQTGSVSERGGEGLQDQAGADARPSRVY